MSQTQREIIEFAELKLVVVRDPGAEMYLALQPPEALPYVVAPMATPIEDVVAFAQERLEVLRSLRADMLKHFSKTKSLKCHFRTGDVIHLLGRPFMLRVSPISSARKGRKPTRGLMNLKARLYNDLSLIDLFVVQVGNFEQGQAAYLSYAQPIFARNVPSLLEQSMARALPEVAVPKTVKCRPMRDAWVSFDAARDVVYFSESLIPYPVHAVVYVYIAEAIRHYAPAATAEEREAMLAAAVPNWQEMKALVSDPNNMYAV